MAMETMRSCLQSQYDLAEIYSHPRAVKEANVMGMQGGFFLDFSAPDPDGYIWDFSEHECRQKAFAYIRGSRPYMMIASLECNPFSTIQNFNMRTLEGTDNIERAQAELLIDIFAVTRSSHAADTVYLSWVIARPCYVNPAPSTSPPPITHYA